MIITMKHININKLIINLKKNLIKTFYELGLIENPNEIKIYVCHFITLTNSIILVIYLRKHFIFTYDSSLINSKGIVNLHFDINDHNVKLNSTPWMLDSPMFSLN